MSRAGNPGAVAGIALAGAVLAGSAWAGKPLSWDSRGVGGGGALFAPSLSPYDTNNWFVASDMSGLFRTKTGGGRWDPVHFQELQANRETHVQFTSVSNVLYALDCTPVGGVDMTRAARSLDGGQTWSLLANDPTAGYAYTLYADPDATNRILVSSYSAIYLSTNYGVTFSQKYTYGAGSNGCRVGGVYFDGANIFVGCNAGLLVSTDSGATFGPAGSGIPAGEEIISLAGARQGVTLRLFCVTAPAGSTYAGMPAEEMYAGRCYTNVYVSDWPLPWLSRKTGIAAGHTILFVGAARNNLSVAYLGGQTSTEYPVVYRSGDGGLLWQSALQTANNQNVYTGWAGAGGDRDWTYGAGVLGLAVASGDSSSAAFTDMGFVHYTRDSGVLWRQAYLDPADQTTAGQQITKRRSYHGVGMEPSTCWWMTWADSNTMFASFSDIRAVRSKDAGTTWSFDYSGHTFNSTYQTVQPFMGPMLAAVSTVHDLYQSTRISDEWIDGGDGEVKYSTDKGATWQVLHDFGHPVYGLSLDPNYPYRLYATVAHSSAGGIYRTDNFQAGSGSVWVKLANPTRTQGHPAGVRVLNDGTIVCTHSARLDIWGDFTDSSGVFVSGDGGASWVDRSHANMHYWTKDLVVDPADAAQNTWYVCVWSGWGGAPNGKGGLYRTRDRGLSWSRLNSRDRVSSCAFNPANTNELYFTTEVEGLWLSTNIQKTVPSFAVVTNYPFRQPERVFYNPYVSNEIWVTSFGNGLRVGRIPVVAQPVFVPGGGTSAVPVTVAISCATTGAVIRYTVDGTEPTESSPAGTNVWIGEETLLRARAFLPDWNDSPVRSAQYGLTDADGDRLPDWVETGTYVYQSLTNTGTLSNDPDTDDDGRNDYVEVHQGTDPFNALSFPRVALDFDGDAQADICLRRAANGKIWALHSTSNAVWASAAGVSNWIAAAADYDGDGKTDPSWFIPSTTVWRIYPSTSNYAERLPRVTIGGANDIPVPADFDGDGKADLAVFRRASGKFWYRESGVGYTNLLASAIGQSAWLPAVADYDGDGKADFSWFIPSTQVWRIYESSNAYAERLPRVTIGGPDDIPVPADYDGDGKADLAVFRRANGKFWVRYSSLGYANLVASEAGTWSWLPAPADFDGDGKADYAWFLPSTKTWRVYESSRAYQERARVVLGGTSDWPLASPLLGW